MIKYQFLAADDEAKRKLELQHKTELEKQQKAKGMLTF